MDEVETNIRDFEAKLAPEQLQEARWHLFLLNDPGEPDPALRAEMRVCCLYLWLRTVELTDRFADPSFDVTDGPWRQVPPPPDSRGNPRQLGIAPSAIEDPVQRADYERAIAANEAKSLRHSFQASLLLVQQSVTEGAEEFLRKRYTSAPDDHAEAVEAIDQIITLPSRRAALLKLLASLR